MLLIKTVVRLTDIIPGEQSQYGVFTNQHIPKGQIIWDYQNVVSIRPETYNFLKENKLTEHMEKYGTVDSFGVWTVDSDNTRYMNHSTDPNVMFIDNIGIATRDIDINEELLCDYYKITEPWHAKQLLGIKN